MMQQQQQQNMQTPIFQDDNGVKYYQTPNGWVPVDENENLLDGANDDGA
jgi:hypothetical protein